MLVQFVFVFNFFFQSLTNAHKYIHENSFRDYGVNPVTILEFEPFTKSFLRLPNIFPMNNHCN